MARKRWTHWQPVEDRWSPSRASLGTRWQISVSTSIGTGKNNTWSVWSHFALRWVSGPDWSGVSFVEAGVDETRAICWQQLRKHSVHINILAAAGRSNMFFSELYFGEYKLLGQQVVQIFYQFLPPPVNAIAWLSFQTVFLSNAFIIVLSFS